MKNNEAIAKRIMGILDEKHLTKYNVIKTSMVDKHNFYKIINCRSKNIEFSILTKICYGLNIKLKDFFDSPLFEFENLNFD